MATKDWQERTKLLLKEDNFLKLEKANVLVVGLGGVGGYAAENLCRAGIGNMTIIDADTVNYSNRNRQIIALKSTEGQPKVEIFKARLLDINPDLNLLTYNEFMHHESIEELLTKNKYDYIVDAIDTLTPKLFLIFHAINKNIKIVSSMGAGGRSDATQIYIDDISKSKHCRLAFVVRKKLRKMGIEKGFKVVYSREFTEKESEQQVFDERNKKTTLGTISYMPAIFGCYCAYVVINDIIE